MIHVGKQRVKRKRKDGTTQLGPWQLRWRDYNGGAHTPAAMLPNGVPCRTAREAEAVRTAKEVAINKGEVSASPDRMTVGEAINAWTEDRTGEPVRPRTMRIRRGALRRLVEVCGGSVDPDTHEAHCTYLLRNIGDRKISEVRAALGPLAPNSRVVYVRLLSAFFNRAVRKGWMARNPIDGMGRLQSKRARIYTAEEVRAMLDVGKDDWFGLYVRLMLHSGLRPAEALTLRWQDVRLDTDPAEVRIQPAEAGWQTVEGFDYPLLPWQPKNEPSIREVPIPSHVADALRTWRVAGAGRSPYVFVGLPRLKRLSARAKLGKYPPEAVNGMGERFRRLQTEAARLLAARRGVGAVDWTRGVLHDCRKTFTDALKRMGVDESIRKRVMGHSLRDTLGLHYETLTAHDKKRVADAMELAYLGEREVGGLRVRTSGGIVVGEGAAPAGQNVANVLQSRFSNVLQPVKPA